jgi:hypothetical protein
LLKTISKELCVQKCIFFILLMLDILHIIALLWLYAWGDERICCDCWSWTECILLKFDCNFIENSQTLAGIFKNSLLSWFAFFAFWFVQLSCRRWKPNIQRFIVYIYIWIFIIFEEKEKLLIISCFVWTPMIMMVCFYCFCFVIFFWTECSCSCIPIIA